MPNIPPYAFLDPESGEVCGIDAEIVRAAAERLGRRLVIRVVPFAERSGLFLLSEVTRTGFNFKASDC